MRTTIHLKKIALIIGTVLIAGAMSSLPVRALDNPVNPNAPSPNAGVAKGHRAAGASTARRPGNLPAYTHERYHSFTGVSTKTP